MLPNRKKLIKICEEYNKEIIETVCEICTPISKDEIINVYGLNNCEKRAHQLGINIDIDKPFAICPVFITREQADISTYSLCLAFLILSKVKDNHPSAERAKALRDRLLNTIIITAYPNEDVENKKTLYYWPTTISKTKTISSGTCNQTCVALSALWRAGFLKSDGISEETLESRYKLIIGALSWLTRIQKSSGETGVWVYGEDCKSVSNNKEKIEFSVLSSHFCYENLKKYISFFNSPAGSNRMAANVDLDIIDNMHSACQRFEKWVERNMHDSGGFSKTNISHVDSALHTCLCQIIYFYDTKNLDIQTFKTMTNYIVSNVNMNKIQANDVLEKYQYKVKDNDTDVYSEDTYEIIPEFLFISYSTKLLTCDYSWRLSYFQKKKLRAQNYIAFDKLLKKTKHVKLDSGSRIKECVCLMGVQTGEEKAFPIYGLYDLQYCLKELLESSKENKRIPIICMPIGFLFFSRIFLALLALAIFIFSCSMDSVNSITGILASIVVIMASYVLKPLIESIQKKQ